jgi:hypothetical protein
MAAARIQDLTLLILDLSDISKKYARKMEYLARVRDGSADNLASGYWLLQIIGAEPGKHMSIIVFTRSGPGPSERKHRDPDGHRDGQPGDPGQRGVGHGPGRRQG